MQERILADFKAESGVGSTSGTAATFPDAQTRMLSGSKDYDCWETIGERLPAVVQTNNVEAIPASAIKNWANIRDTFTKADPNGRARRKSLAKSGQTTSIRTSGWSRPSTITTSVGYRPDLVSAEEANTWTAIFDDKFKGKRASTSIP